MSAVSSEGWALQPLSFCYLCCTIITKSIPLLRMGTNLGGTYAHIKKPPCYIHKHVLVDNTHSVCLCVYTTPQPPFGEHCISEWISELEFGGFRLFHSSLPGMMGGLYLRSHSHCAAHTVCSHKLESLHCKSMELHQFAQAEELAQNVLVVLHSVKTMFIIESNTKCS